MGYREQRRLVVIREALKGETAQQKKYAQRAQEALELGAMTVFQLLQEEEKKHGVLLTREFEKV